MYRVYIYTCWVGWIGEETTIQQKTVIPLAPLLYTPSPLSRSAYPLQPHTGPLPIGCHFRLPPPIQPTDRYIYPVHHATDILHPPAYLDGTDMEFRNVGY